MGNKELRRLKRRDLLQMLLTQCEETERLQKELDDTAAELESVEEGYERLKKKLDIKDERLNQKDAKIARLKSEIEEIKASRVIELEEAGSIAEASLRLNGIFEAAQRCAEQYLMNVKRLSSDTAETEKNQEYQKNSFSIYDQQAADRQKIPYESGWGPITRRKRLHG